MTKELIEEARDMTLYARTTKHGAVSHADMIDDLADALEASLAARQPSGDDREALVRVVANHPIAPLMRLGGDAGYPLADAILAAGFSRAAVPNAANRELTEAIRLTVEYVGNDMLPAIEGWDWYDALVKYAPEVAQAFVDKPIHFPKSAERDAALAAVERCRALVAEWKHEGPSGPFPDRIAIDVGVEVIEPLLAALDGAPEPETPELFSGTNAALDRLTVRKAAPAEAFCIEHGNFHAVELGDPTCEFEDGFGEPVEGEKP